jgi:hypothetical protein
VLSFRRNSGNRFLWPVSVCNLGPQEGEEEKMDVTLRLTVSQFVFVSGTLVGLATTYYFLSE